MDEFKNALQEAFPHIDFDKEKHLVDDGLLDSLSMVTIISMLEDMYGVTVTMEYIQPKYFQSLETMWEMKEELS